MDKPTNVISNPNRWGLQCTFISKEGDICHNWSVKGLTICHKHGGSMPTLREHGQKVMAAAAERHRIEELAEKYELEGPIENPLLAMQMLAAEVVGFKDYLFEKIKELDDFTNTDFKGAEDAKAIVQLYERALDRTTKLMADMSKLKIEERLAQISERQGELVTTMLEHVLERLDLGDRKTEARHMIIAEMKRMAISAS
jgi:hypothetical protein